MGLDTSHDCWSGPYSSFTRFRRALGRAALLPMVKLPMSADLPNITIEYPDTDELPDDDPLRRFLEHSDCSGVIAVEECAPLALRLHGLLPSLAHIDVPSDGVHDRLVEKAERFIAGLHAAARAGEPVEFF